MATCDGWLMRFADACAALWDMPLDIPVVRFAQGRGTNPTLYTNVKVKPAPKKGKQGC